MQKTDADTGHFPREILPVFDFSRVTLQQPLAIRDNMTDHPNDSTFEQKIENVLGYLNFSSGTHDPVFLVHLNEIFRYAGQQGDSENPLYLRVNELLLSELKKLDNLASFADSRQAEKVLKLVFEKVLPEYLEYHRDLLFHRGPESIFNSMFVGRTCEVVLSVLAETEYSNGELIDEIVAKLNDYIGHRPIAALETQKHQPYSHEWVRPIPIYIRNVGVACAAYHDVVTTAMELLFNTDPNLLEMAQLDPNLLDELAIDPRAFDFEHPVNKRPNHHFGQWDEHHIDNQGNFRRFVIHQVTLDALLSRVEQNTEIPKEQLVLEAGAVLAGTILMAAGICGRGPGAHDSSVTLGNLLPQIAYYRDEFYSQLLESLDGDHKQRLMEESEKRQQPFGAARQHLNWQLARNRAFQMVHVQLALIFARMGYGNAALRHANVVPVASARMICQIDCHLFSGHQALEDKNHPLAVETIPRIFDLLNRAVECGAIIDPWNIIGFDANYSLFQGNENTVRDHRADELVELMDQILEYCCLVWIAIEAADHRELSSRVQVYFREIVDWWRKFAVHELSSVDSADPKETFEATQNVAKALNLWHKSGADSGNVEFWANHAKLFNSPKAYILAIECLIDHDDFLTSMALLIHWLGQCDFLPLQQGAHSFQSIVAVWIGRQRTKLLNDPSPELAAESWRRLRKFCDYVEANAGDFWHVPNFDLDRNHGGQDNPADPVLMEQEDDYPEEDDLYNAAYDGMVYRDTTDDGIEGAIHEDNDHSDEELQAEMNRIVDRLDFLSAFSHYWFNSALVVNTIVSQQSRVENNRDLLLEQKDKIAEWSRHAERNVGDLKSLVADIHAYPLPEPDGSIDSLVQYDRHRLFKESLLDQAINVCVEMANAARLLNALNLTIGDVLGEPVQQTKNPGSTDDQDDEEDQIWASTIAAVLSRDLESIPRYMTELLDDLVDRPLLYVPLSKGGDPLRIIEARVRQFAINHLLASVPRLGLFEEARELVQTTLIMERNQTVRQGAVTEFDEMFRTGYVSMVQSLIDSGMNSNGQVVAKAPSDSEQADADQNEDAKLEPVDDRSQKRQKRQAAETALFDCLEMLTESMLMIWLSHSQTLRLSVLEKVKDKGSWTKLVSFIDRFGDQLFTQQFLNLSNIRAILHQGVDRWLTQIEEIDEDLCTRLIDEINGGYPRRDAVRNITLVLESIIENFNEYRDYNCTTTQSDKGELIYILLDFLRLRAKYDQVCWNLKPVIWAHESLVRQGQTNVARLWRRLLTERVKPESEKFIKSLQRLQEKYSIQMATVNQRINERFVHAMHVDRLISLVEPAMDDPRSEASQQAFEMIEHHAESMTQQPIGVGFELPSWLTALDMEVERVCTARADSCILENDQLVDPLLPGIDDLRQQLERLPRRQ